MEATMLLASGKLDVPEKIFTDINQWVEKQNHRESRLPAEQKCNHCRARRKPKFSGRKPGGRLAMPPVSGGKVASGCAGPRAQQCEKHGTAPIPPRAQKIRGLLRPGTAALRRCQCQAPETVGSPDPGNAEPPEIRSGLAHFDHL
jgi:hypothetical protein